MISPMSLEHYHDDYNDPNHHYDQFDHIHHDNHCDPDNLPQMIVI